MVRASSVSSRCRQSSPASLTRTTSMRSRSTSADLQHETSRRECGKLEFEKLLWDCQVVFCFFFRDVSHFYVSWPDSHICRLSSALSTSGFHVLSGNINFLFAFYSPNLKFCFRFFPSKPTERSFELIYF